MSEKEAKDIIYMWSMERASDGDVESCEAFDMAIKALEELNQYKQGVLVLIPADVYKRQCDELDEYKAIGTVEEFQDDKFKMVLKRHGSLSNMVDALEEYHTIGSEEQCRETVERMKPKKPVEYEDKYYGCPKCGNPLMHKWERYPTIRNPKSKGLPCCLNCLQAIDWSE